jgi:rhamnose transport system ATP-binding protein
MPAPLLQLTNITKSFLAVLALKGVSFSLSPGEVHAVLGENGAGKSTLIKVVTGAHQPDSGEIEIGGQRVDRLTPTTAHRLGIACIYQQPALFAELSVAENIALALEPPNALRRVKWKERGERARTLLRRIGASIDPDIEVRRLSMPEQQLVEIAKALGAGARIILMDEPTASLTEKEVQLLQGVIRELRSQGAGVIYISHRLEEIFQIADRVTVLRDGESVGTRPVQEIDHAALIKLMIGREISSIYPAAEKPPSDVLLSIRNLSCREANVRDVSFEVRGGEIFGLSGLVGAGRTELARTLFGITPATEGAILLAGQQVEIHSPQAAVSAGLAYVPEDRRRHGVILPMPISANTTLAALRQLFPFGWLESNRERETAGKYARDLAIKAPSVETVAGALSGGNQQKVALARWLATEPKVLILDEPTQGVDVGAKAEIHKIIRRLAARGLAVIMISSELPEVLGMSDRIGVMRGGKLVTILEGAAATSQSVMAAALGHDEISRTTAASITG